MAITRVSTAADGTQGNGLSMAAVASADGNLIAFTSAANNFVGNDTNNLQDVFVKNVATGAITRVSTAADGTQANGTSVPLAFSPDGTRIAFTSSASNLVAGDNNGGIDIFVKNLTTGAIARVSTASDGTQITGNGFPDLQFSGDGNTIVFTSNADSLVANDTNNRNDVFAKNLTTGVVTRVSTAADGTQAAGNSTSATISADGTRVAFVSVANNLVPGDTNGLSDIFVKDLTTGGITRVSTASDGTQANGASVVTQRGGYLSADGTRVAFESAAANLVPGDTNGLNDIFVKDLTTGAVTRASVASDGTQNTAATFNPVLSANGTRVAFEGPDGTLVPGDSNGRFDVFAADVVCFTTGTRIRTGRGEVAVEALRVGDRAVTASGALRPVTWIGTAGSRGPAPCPSRSSRCACARAPSVPAFPPGPCASRPDTRCWSARMRTVRAACKEAFSCR